MFRLLVILILLLHPVATLAQPAQPANISPDENPNKLIIGVRADASPFSSRASGGTERGLVAKSGPIRRDGYDGYMIYICDEILKQMLLPDEQPLITPDQIEVKNVDELLADHPDISDRFGLLQQNKIDILCDPATISRDRVRSFAVSPPLFLTGISYLSRAGVEGPRKICATKKALIGGVGTTNAIDYGVRAIVRSGGWPKFRAEIIAALREPQQRNGPSKCPTAPDHAGAIWSASNHLEMAQLFCNGDIAYYVGDYEIIQASVARIPGCEVATSIQRYTADRYAIFGDIDFSTDISAGAKANWKPMVISRFFELLNRDVVTSDSVLDRAYAATFGESEQTQALKLFYSSIRGAP